MALDEQQTEEVLEMLERYARHYSDNNAKKIFSLASKGISGFGSGADEVIEDYSGFKESIVRDLAQSEKVDVTFYVFKVDGQMPFAWVTSFCVFDAVVNGEALSMEGRMTALLRNTGSRWLFEQLHFSMPFGGQETGESFPGIR